MQKIYADNGLPFWNNLDIAARDFLTLHLANKVHGILLDENRGWLFERIESPCLIPSGLVSSEYAKATTPVADADVYALAEDDFVLRPETTAASYEYAKHRFEHQEVNPPYCVWQLAKSFRRENDQVSKNMRFKEFYQLEFQCIYTEETKNNYMEAVLEPLRKTVEHITGLKAQLVPSDRLPSYSLRTMDIEVETKHKWLEVCSISARKDVPFDWKDKKLANLEIAFGADRLTQVVGGQL